MNRLVVSALHVGFAGVLVLGLSACNRDANADGGVGAAAQQQGAADGAKYARVTSVTPVREAASAPQQVCHDEVVTTHKPVQDTHQIAGTAIGAVAGGLLGNQVGGGKGRTLATVAGAVGGLAAVRWGGTVPGRSSTNRKLVQAAGNEAGVLRSPTP